LSWSHSCILLAVYLGSLSCWKVNLCPRLRPWVLWTEVGPSHCFTSKSQVLALKSQVKSQFKTGKSESRLKSSLNS
jgi:hypothetical protein